MNEHGMITSATNGWMRQERRLREGTSKKEALSILDEYKENDYLDLEWSLWIDGECVEEV